MATEITELENEMLAKNGTYSFSKIDEDGEPLPDGAVRYGYRWRRSVDYNSGKTTTVYIIEESNGVAYFDGPNYAKEPETSRVTVNDVTTFYPNANKIRISRDDAYHDVVLFDDVNTETGEATQKKVVVQFDDTGAYVKHWEVTNAY